MLVHLKIKKAEVFKEVKDNRVIYELGFNSTLSIIKRIDFRNHDLVQSWYKLCESVVGIGVVEGRLIEQQ